MIKRSFIPITFIIIFALIIVINACFFYLAQKTAVGVVTEDSYDKGLSYNLSIEQQQSQLRNGIKGNLDIQNHPSGALVSLEINTACSSANMHLMRTVHDKDDIKAELLPAKSGDNFRYEMLLNKNIIGLWFLRVKCYSGEQEYYFSDKFVLRG